MKISVKLASLKFALFLLPVFFEKTRQRILVSVVIFIVFQTSDVGFVSTLASTLGTQGYNLCGPRDFNAVNMASNCPKCTFPFSLNDIYILSVRLMIMIV